MGANDENVELQDLLVELADFVRAANENLKSIGPDVPAHQEFLRTFASRMFTISNLAKQLDLPRVAVITTLSERVAVMGSRAVGGNPVRKCVASLWDTVTTIKYILEHPGKKTTEVETLLIARLESVLMTLEAGRAGEEY